MQREWNEAQQDRAAAEQAVEGEKERQSKMIQSRRRRRQENLDGGESNAGGKKVYGKATLPSTGGPEGGRLQAEAEGPVEPLPSEEELAELDAELEAEEANASLAGAKDE